MYNSIQFGSVEDKSTTAIYIYIICLLVCIQTQIHFIRHSRQNRNTGPDIYSSFHSKQIGVGREDLNKIKHCILHFTQNDKVLRSVPEKKL